MFILKLKSNLFVTTIIKRCSFCVAVDERHYNFQNIKYGDIANTEDVRLRTGSVRRETNLSSDEDMLDINHHHHSDSNVLSDHMIRIDDTSSHSKLFEFQFSNII